MPHRYDRPERHAPSPAWTVEDVPGRPVAVVRADGGRVVLTCSPFGNDRPLCAARAVIVAAALNRVYRAP